MGVEESTTTANFQTCKFTVIKELGLAATESHLRDSAESRSGDEKDNCHKSALVATREALSAKDTFVRREWMREEAKRDLHCEKVQAVRKHT